MRNLCFCLLIMFMVLTAASSSAETQDVKSIIEKAKNSFESYTISQKINIIVKDGEQITGQLVAGVARKVFPDGNRAVLVLLEPEDLKGLSFLFREMPDYSVDQWVYFPHVGRVTKISGLDAYQRVLNTDFTYADLSFINRKDSFKLLGEENLDGIKTYKIEAIGQGQQYYYSRTILWITKDTYVLVRRDFYDMSNTLWKRQLLEKVVVINGAKTPLHFRMVDLKANTSTEINVIQLNSDVEVPDTIFVPEQLKYSLKCPIWEKVCYPELK